MTDLRPVPIPRHITRPQGCTCAGTDLHRVDCGIFDLPYDQRLAAVEAARQRCERFAADLTRAMFGGIR